MTRFLMILVCSVVLLGCASAPVTLIVTDFHTSEPIEGLKVDVRYPSMLDPFAPGSTHETTDHDGKAAIRVKQHGSRGPQIFLSKRGIANYYDTLSLTAGYVRRAEVEYRESNTPRTLHVQLIARQNQLPIRDVVIELPENYVGPVGVLEDSYDRHALDGPTGRVEVRAEVEGKIETLFATQIDEPCSIHYVFQWGQGDTPNAPMTTRSPTDDKPRVARPFGRYGGLHEEIEPGVRQGSAGRSARHLLYFIGSDEQLSGYRDDRFGSKYQFYEDELERVLGEAPKSTWR